MKLRFLTRVVEKLLGMTNDGDTPPADMHLPDFLLAFGLVLIMGGIVLTVAFFFLWDLWLILVAVVAFLFGAAAVLCWRNQRIQILSEDVFTYTTFLGKTHEYRFSDITALRQNNDSLTLFLGTQKVHIESMAILSDRLVDKINQALAQNQ